MTQFSQFDISDFLNEFKEPLFLMDSEEILFFNSYFSNGFESISDDWIAFFQREDLVQELKTFFETGAIPKKRLIKSLFDKSGGRQAFEWTFINVPSSYSGYFLIAKGTPIRTKSEAIEELENSSDGALTEELMYMYSILRNTHDLIAVFDEDGNYKFVSESVTETLGLETGQLLGRNFKEFIQAGIIEIVKGSFEDVLHSQNEVPIDFWVNKLDGSRFYLESFAKNLLDHPVIQGILISSRDITDFALTGQLLQDRYEIENLINQVSAEIINGNLIDLEEKFEQSLQLIGDFLKAGHAKILILNREINHLEILNSWTGEGKDEADSILMTSKYFFMFNQKRSQLEEGKVIYTTFSKSENPSKAKEKGLLLIPMISSNRLIGVIQFEFEKANPSDLKKDFQVFRQFGDILAGAFLGSQITRKLKRNEDLLTYTEILSRSGSWRYSAFKDRFYFSSGLSKMFGLGDQPMVQEFSGLIYRIDKSCRTDFITNLKKASREITRTSGEFTMQDAEGQVRYISYEIEGKKEFLSEGIEVFGFFTDITHKRAAESYLKLQSQILAQVGDPILVTNTQLEIIYYNEKAQETFSNESENPSGILISYFLKVDWEIGESFSEILSKLQLGEIWRNERHVQKAKSQVFAPFELIFQAIVAEGGETIGYSMIFHGLEEKHRNEQIAKRAKLIVENSPVVLFRVNPSQNFQIDYISENVSRFGYDAKDLIDNKVSILSLIHKEDRARIQEIIRGSNELDGIRSYSGEYRLVTKSGEEVWVEDRTTDVRDENGRIILHEGLFQDISDRKNLEVIQRERDELYRVLAANIPDTNVFLMDRSRKYIVAEGTNFDKWGLSREDFQGKSLADIQLTPLQEIAPILDRVLNEREVVETEFFHKGRFYYRIIRPIIQDGEAKYALSIIRDIHEEYQAKQDLLRSEEKYRRLVEDSTEIIFSLTETFLLQYVSPNVKQFLDYESEEVIGRSIFDYLNPDDLDVFRGMLEENQDLLSDTQYLEFRLRHKSGEYRVFSSNGRLTVDKSGIHRFYTGIARDISKLKEAQRELLLAKEKAEQASQVKSQFLSVMSHEIRTPMNAVIGLAHFLMEENPRPDQLENLKTLQFSAENLMALINDILDFNKIDSGKVELEKSPFDVKNLVTRIVHSHSFQANEKNIQLITEIDSSIPDSLIGDSLRLGQIINNLISNAVKFTEKGYVKISVIQEYATKDQREIRFVFEDTGIGIPESKRKTIFEAFTQASSSTSRKYGGTGLGLAIVKRLVELHGGEIELRPKKGGGSIFEFTLSFACIDQIEKQQKEQNQLLAKSLEHAKILVAEDNMVNQILIRKFLSKWNTKDLDIASDGREALELFGSNHYNLVILDLQMPELDGFEVAQAIRNHSDISKRKIPILALTAASIHEVKEQLDEVGINDFVPKPFTPDILYEKIVRYLNAESPS